MRSIINNCSKISVALLTDEAKGAAGLGKQQRTATPRKSMPAASSQIRSSTVVTWTWKGVHHSSNEITAQLRSFEAAPQRSSDPKGPNRGAKFLNFKSFKLLGSHAYLCECFLPLRRRTAMGNPAKEGKYTSAGRQGLAVVHTFRAGGEKSLNIFLFRA
jgi:hypothetical protein